MRKGMFIFGVLIFISQMVFAANSSPALSVPKAGIFGLGAQVGTMGSIAGKYWLSDRAAVDLGIEFMGRPWSVLYTDFLWHLPPGLWARLFGRGFRLDRETSFYFGGGLGAGFWDRSDGCSRWHCNWNAGTTGTGNGFFLRTVAGLEWYPSRTKYGVFAELGPSFMLYPEGVQAFDIAVGGRYYF